VTLQSALDHLDASTSALQSAAVSHGLLPVAVPNLSALVAALLDAREVLSALVRFEQPSAFPNERP
jgi:hypothetical protein